MQSCFLTLHVWKLQPTTLHPEVCPILITQQQRVHEAIDCYLSVGPPTAPLLLVKRPVVFCERLVWAWRKQQRRERERDGVPALLLFRVQCGDIIPSVLCVWVSVCVWERDQEGMTQHPVHPPPPTFKPSPHGCRGLLGAMLGQLGGSQCSSTNTLLIKY